MRKTIVHPLKQISVFGFFIIIGFLALIPSILIDDVFAVDTWALGDTGDAAGTKNMFSVSMSDSTNGVAVGNGGTIVYTSSTSTTSTSTTSTGGSSDGEHNSKPTFGLDHKTNTQRVDGGLVLNGVTFDVDDNFWTAVPMQYFNVGEIQNFTSKVYAPHDLRVMEFLFGIPELGKWNEAEATVTFEFDYTGELQKVEAKNVADVIINPDSIVFATDMVHCKSGDAEKLCRQVSMELSFNEAPLGKILAMQAIDEKRRSNIVYFNDGITMEGDSQNPPTTQQIISEIKYQGLQSIQRIDKENDIWMTLDKAEPVLLYKQNESGTFIPVEYRVSESIPDKITMNMDRLHSEFNDIIQYEISRATIQFDSQLIQAEIGPSFSYEYSLEGDRIDNIQSSLKSEKLRALEVYEKLYSDNEKSGDYFVKYFELMMGK